MSLAVLPKLLTEAEAYRRFGDVLEAKELRRARAAGALGYYDLPGGERYSEAEIAQYLIKRLEREFAEIQPTAVGFVYFISFKGLSDRPIKIGHAFRPEQRLAALQIAHYEELELINQITGDRDAEQEIHRKIGKLHIRGEWFRRDERLVDLMDEVVFADARKANRRIEIRRLLARLREQ